MIHLQSVVSLNFSDRLYRKLSHKHSTKCQNGSPKFHERHGNLIGWLLQLEGWLQHVCFKMWDDFFFFFRNIKIYIYKNLQHCKLHQHVQTKVNVMVSMGITATDNEQWYLMVITCQLFLSRQALPHCKFLRSETFRMRHTVYVSKQKLKSLDGSKSSSLL